MCHGERIYHALIQRLKFWDFRWEAANGNPALADLYIDTMTALDAIDKRAIYFIDGTGQASYVTAWGDGFVTNKGIISQNGLSDPTPFFDRLSTMPFLDRVRHSPVQVAARCEWLSTRSLASMSCCA